MRKRFEIVPQLVSRTDPAHPAHMKPRFASLSVLLLGHLSSSLTLADQAGRKFAENSLHALPALQITVGHVNADIQGTDNRALQAAVDYVANLGGGLVLIGPGQYLMRDSLHLRSRVTVRGHGAETILKKDREHRSPLAADADFGEAAMTLQNPDGFKIGGGVYLASKTQRNFHGVCATILNGRSNYFTLTRSMNADLMVNDTAFAATIFPVISGYNLEDAVVENLTIDGNRAENPTHADGCRTAGIFSTAATTRSSPTAWCATTTAMGSVSSNPMMSGWRPAWWRIALDSDCTLGAGHNDLW